MNCRIGTVALMSAALIVEACASGESAASPSLEVADSAGVEVVTMQGSRGDYAPLGVVDPVPVLRVGSLDGARSDAFGAIRTVRALPDGSIVVADGQALELRRFAPDGRYVVTIGGRGAGPGEFLALTSIVFVSQDSLWIWDSRALRVSVFATHGEFSRSFQMTPVGNDRPYGIGRLRDGDLLAFSVLKPGLREASEGRSFRLDSVLVTRRAAAGGVFDTLAIGPILESATEVFAGGNSTVATLPFGRRGFYAVTDEGVVGGYNDRFEIRWWGAEGLARITRFPAFDQPLSPRDIAAKRAEWESVEAPTPEGLRSIRQAFEEFPFPELRPAFERVLSASDRGVWVQEHRVWRQDGSAKWWYLDGSDGGVRGYLEIRPDLTVHEIGAGYVLGSREDEVGVPIVELYRWSRQ